MECLNTVGTHHIHFVNGHDQLIHAQASRKKYMLFSLTTGCKTAFEFTNGSIDNEYGRVCLHSVATDAIDFPTAWTRGINKYIIHPRLSVNFSSSITYLSRARYHVWDKVTMAGGVEKGKVA